MTKLLERRTFELITGEWGSRPRQGKEVVLAKQLNDGTITIEQYEKLMDWDKTHKLDQIAAEA